MNNNDDIKDYTKIEAFVKKAIIVNCNVDFDTKYFIKYGANHISTPKETMDQLTTIEFNIEGELANGLRINIDGISDSSYTYTDDDKYLSSLNIINIIINEDGIINYTDATKSSIILINPFLLLDLNVNIYENITKTESYGPYDPYENITKTDLKINKLTLEIIANNTTDINIDRYSTLIYLKEIIVLINVNFNKILTFSGTYGNLHNLNIIIYHNT